MHHIMFDIDGTLVESYEIDAQCFVEAVKEVVGLEVNPDWTVYQHVTDAGILEEIFAKHGVADRQDAMSSIKQLFIEKLKQAIAKEPVREVSGAAVFIADLKAKDNIIVSLATGGWYESAVLKLDSAGIDYSSLPFASSNDHISRVEIMKAAEREATKGANYPCTYFGDGGWDKKACEELGFDFVLVGNRLQHNPSIDSYDAIEKIWRYIV